MCCINHEAVIIASLSFKFVGIRKRVAKLAATKVSFLIIGRWIPAIVDHLFYVVQNSPSGDYRTQYWKSVANHITNIHKHSYSHFPECLHGDQSEPVFDEDGSPLVVAWVEAGRCLSI